MEHGTSAGHLPAQAALWGLSTPQLLVMDVIAVLCAALSKGAMLTLLNLLVAVACSRSRLFALRCSDQFLYWLPWSS